MSNLHKCLDCPKNIRQDRERCHDCFRKHNAAHKAHKCARAECPNMCTKHNVAYCSDDCRELVKASRTTFVRHEAVRVRLEDRLVSGFHNYLSQHPGRRLTFATPKVKKSHPTTHEMLLMLSDAHYPEVVDPAIAMGLEYNSVIAKARLERMRDVVMRYKQLRETSYPIRKLTVACLGDMLSGDIHEELEITNEKPLPEALVDLAYLLHDMFASFAKVFPEVEVIVLPGNHPRTKKQPRFKQKTITNFEYILGHMIAALSQGAYMVQVPKDMIYIHEVFGFRIGMSHGDAVQSNSFAGIPFYGIRQRREAMQSLLRHLGQPAVDYLLMGHFHQPTVLEGTDATVIINGALKGGDEYSLGTRLSSNDPVQYLLTFHEKHGLTDYSRINLKGVK